MFIIVVASKACKITILTKRSKVRKANCAFLHEGINYEDPTLISMPSESAHSARRITYPHNYFQLPTKNKTKVGNYTSTVPEQESSVPAGTAAAAVRP